MEATQTEQIVSSTEASETKIPTSPSKRTESTSSQSCGAIPKGKSRSGGVKLGSFRLGGKKKANSGGDISQEVKEEKRRYTKFKKGKANDNHIEDSAESTPSPATKQSIPSKASSLVRKLSIGKYKGGKNPKSPETPSSQEDWQSVGKTDASTNEDYTTASPASSVATGGRPSLERTASTFTPTEDVASPIDQSTADIKVNKSETRISQSSNGGDTVPQAMSGIKDPSLQDITPLELELNAPEFVDVEGENKLEPVPGLAADFDDMNFGETFKYGFESDKFEELAATKASDDGLFPTSLYKQIFIPDMPDMSPLRTIELPTGVNSIAKNDLWFTKKFYDEDDDLSPEYDPEKKPTTKDQILSITTPMLLKQRRGIEEYFKMLEPEAMDVEPYGLLVPNIDELFSLGVEEEEGVSGPESPDVGNKLSDTRMPATSGFSQSLAQQIGEKREHLYKILVIGELGTGKTSIIKRYVHQFFSQHYRATIGVDFALKVINWDANTIIRLQLWDIAGQERFGNMTRVYYKEAVGAFIVFDVTRAATFDAVLKWKQDLDTKVQLPDGTAIPCVLLANKCDQQKEGLVNNAAKMEEYCKERGFTDWFETSAKENINIEDAARCLVTKILQNDKMIHNSDSSKDLERFALDGKNQRDQKSKTCAC